jgi:hypothetical protein
VTRPLDEVSDDELLIWAAEQDQWWQQAYDAVVERANTENGGHNRKIEANRYEIKEERKQSRPDLIMAVVLVVGMGLFLAYCTGDGKKMKPLNCWGSGYTKICD